MDLLLQNPNTDRRYEVELQLGASDESHIIRTIEYWDIERRRYPQYDHCAVLIAEDITSRFLNVISLFNGSIPLIALKLEAIDLRDAVTLVFTRVLDEFQRGLVDEDEAANSVPADRDYWEARASTETVGLALQLVELCRGFDPELRPNFNKGYIGVLRDQRPFNFIGLRPTKSVVVLDMKLPQAQIIDQLIDDLGLDTLDYHTGAGRYRLRLRPQDVDEHGETLADLMRQAHALRSN
ncbi:MAG: hypothetical protein AAFU56_05680 [Pseudomonadota bacterium]